MRCCSRNGYAEAWAKLKELWKRQPRDVAATSFVVALTVISYLYGMLWVTRILIGYSDYSAFSKLVLFIAPTWIIYGILGNIYYIHKRNSFALKLLPLPFQPADLPINGHGYTSCIYEPDQPRLQDEAVAYGNDMDAHEIATAVQINKNCNAQKVEEILQKPWIVDPTKWHSCNTCQIKVPPRSWHCFYCQNCVLRRDHHCIFAMACVGEENQANFIGFLLYLSLGSMYAYLVGALYRKDFGDGTPIWLTTVKTMTLVYPFILEISFHNIIVCTLFGLAWITFGFFIIYIYRASVGQTAFDAAKRISRIKQQQHNSWYERLEDFLGSYPILRILIPGFPRRKIIYEYKPDLLTIQVHINRSEKNDKNKNPDFSYTLVTGQ